MKTKNDNVIIKIDTIFSFKYNGYGVTLIESHNTKKGKTNKLRYYPTVESLLERYVDLKLLNKPDKKKKFEDYIKEYKNYVNEIKKVGKKIDNQIKKNH